MVNPFPPHPVEAWYASTPCRWDLSASSLPPLSADDLGVELGAISLGYQPRQGGQRLREAIARHYPGATEANVLVTTGAVEALYLLQKTLLGPGDRLAVRLPAYPALYRVANELGCIRVAPGEAADLTILNSPHNPTGELVPASLIERVAAVSRYWAIDEVFRGLVLSGEEGPTAFEGGGISVGSASKTLAMPGARIGWLVGPEELIQPLAERRDDTTLCPNALAEELVASALDQFEALCARHVGHVRANWELVQAYMDLPLPAGGVTLWLPVPGGDSLAFCQSLLAKTEVLLLPGVLMGQEGFARLGFGGDRQVLAEGLEKLAAFWRWYTANLSEEGDRHADFSTGPGFHRISDPRNEPAVPGAQRGQSGTGLS